MMIAAAPGLDEIQDRLLTFCRAHTADAEASIANVRLLPGHGSFAYAFTMRSRSVDGDESESLELRLSAAGDGLGASATFRRQVRLLDELREKEVPVPQVRWHGDDPQWFSRPYLVLPRPPGRPLLLAPGRNSAVSDEPALRRLCEQGMAALARVHAIDWRATLPEWGPPMQPAEDVARWDRMWTQVADQELVQLGPEVRLRLLETAPATAHMGICHGDFQPANLLVDGEDVSAVLGWELACAGPVLSDLGWFLLVVERQNWVPPSGPQACAPEPREIAAMYARAAGYEPQHVDWFRALAAYKFAVVAGFNLTVQRRGDGVDGRWATLKPSIPNLLRRAVAFLDGEA
jgi:aminoglycoside phosphotransferase (APT) family kinase protein